MSGLYVALVVANMLMVTPSTEQLGIRIEYNLQYGGADGVGTSNVASGAAYSFEEAARKVNFNYTLQANSSCSKYIYMGIGAGSDTTGAHFRFAPKDIYDSASVTRYVASLGKGPAPCYSGSSMKLQDWIIKGKKGPTILGHQTYEAKLARNPDIVTAYFAPSLPYAVGPEAYCGLPGAILLLDQKIARVTAVSVEQSAHIKVAGATRPCSEQMKTLKLLHNWMFEREDFKSP